MTEQKRTPAQIAHQRNQERQRGGKKPAPAVEATSQTKKVYYFEVSVSQDGGAPDRVNPFCRGDKVHWVQKGEPQYDTYALAFEAAVANGERPYRIKHKFVTVAPGGLILEIPRQEGRHFHEEIRILDSR